MDWVSTEPAVGVFVVKAVSVTVSMYLWGVFVTMNVVRVRELSSISAVVDVRERVARVMCCCHGNETQHDAEDLHGLRDVNHCERLE